MASADSSEAPGPATTSTVTVPHRVCAHCSKNEPVLPTHWPHRKNKQGNYVPNGTICLPCEKIRKQKYERRRDEIAAVAPAQDEDKKTLKEQSKLDAARALKTGSRSINDIAPTVLALLEEYAADRDSEFHFSALEFFAARIAPKRLYEEMGAEAAGIGALNDKRPQFIVNILPAQTNAPQGNVVEGELTAPTEVQVLPAPSAPQ